MNTLGKTARGILGLAVVAVSSQAVAGDWPTFRGNPQRNAWTADSLPIERLQPKWRWRSVGPPQPAWYGPAKWDAYAGLRGLHSMRNYDPAFPVAAVGDAVWFASNVDDSVRCLDAARGTLRWRFTADAPIRVAPTLVGDRLYFGADDGFAYCLAAKTGRKIWRFKPSPDEPLIVNNGRAISRWPVRTGVSVVDNTAYFAASLLPWKESYLCAVDARTGKPTGAGRYVRKLNEHTFEGPLVVSPQRLIAPQGRVPPRLFRRRDGAAEGALKGGGGCFVVLTPDNTILHGPGNKAGWLTASGGAGEAIATFKRGSAIVVAGSRSFLLTDTALVASDWVRRKVLWKTQRKASTALTVAGNAVLVGGDDQLQAYDTSSGRLLRTWSAPGRVHDLAVSQGQVYVSTDTGAIVCLAAASKQATAISPNASPAKQPSAASKRSKLKPVAPFRDPALISRWVFQRPHATAKSVRDWTRRQPAKITGEARFERTADAREALILNDDTTIRVAEDFRKADLPQEEMSVEAVVRIDQPQRWGGIVGAVQDNGSYERGWLLGFVNSKFSFAVAGQKGPGRLTYLTDQSPPPLGGWRHVAGVYDGKEMRLYVDGRLANRSLEQKGPLRYPDKAFFEIGAYHDKDEYYRARGAVHEIRLYRRALDPAEIAAHARALRPQQSNIGRLAVGPILRFLGPDRARVRWTTREPSPTVLRWEDSGRAVGDPRPKTEHEVLLTNLVHGRLRRFRIEFQRQGKKVQTRPLECDNFFNFTGSPPALANAPKASSPNAQRAAALAARLPSRRGLGVLRKVDPELAIGLARSTQLRWTVLATDRTEAAALRERFHKAGVYGARLTVLEAPRVSDSRFPPAVANAIVAGSGSGAATAAETAALKRLVRPSGGALWQADAFQRPVAAAESAAEVEAQLGRAAVYRRPALPGSGSWSHLYGRADNAAFGGERLSGVVRAGDLAVQWIGRPGARYQPDRSGRKPSPLSTNGRLYLQGLERLITLDSYNGVVLWSLELPELGRFNMPRDCSNWCADDAHLYVAIRDRLWRIDAATGEVRDRFPVAALLPQKTDPDQTDLKDAALKRTGAERTGPHSTEPTHDWGYVARSGRLLYGSAVRAGSAFKEYWGDANNGWYDAKGGRATDKVCSDTLFALEPDTGRRVWQRSQGPIVNSTITIGGGRVYFAECRNPAARGKKAGRLGKSLWTDLYLVALDAPSGRLVWEQKLSEFDGTVVAYLAYARERLVLVGSARGIYETRVLMAADGKSRWRKTFKWPSDNHGGHMSRPAVVGGTLYVRPAAFELDTGLRLSLKMPLGGCGTYAATSETLLFRSRNVTMWDRKQGGATSWTRLRPDCWLSTIPAGGMLLSPEGGGGCSCGSWMETSIGFIPRTLLRDPKK